MAVALLLVLIALWVLPLADIFSAAVQWSQAHPVAGPTVYLIVFPICVVLLVPASWIAMFAGYVYGVPAGIVLASTGASLGAYLAFLNGRTLARDYVGRRMESNRRLHALDRALAERSFFIVFLTRIALVIPYNLLNYMYSVTSIRTKDYIVPSVLGIVPAISLFVFLGGQARSVEQILSGKLDGGNTSILVLIVSSVALLLVVIVLQRAASKVLRGSLEE